MIVKRKADVSGSMIIRSTKFTVIINLSYLNCDKRISATTIASDSTACYRRPAKHSQPEEIQQRPGDQERRLGRQVELGRGHHDERGNVQACNDSERQRIATRDRLGRRKSAEQCGRNGQHGQDGPARLRSSSIPQRTAHRHKTVINRSLQGVGSPSGRFFRC